MKKRLALLLAVATLTTCVGLVALCSCTASWSGTMMAESELPNSWAVSAQSINGNREREVTMTEESLGTFTVVSSNSSGEVNLKISQDQGSDGKVEQTIDLTSKYADLIEMSAFQAGKVKIEIQCESVKDLEFLANW